MVKVKVKFTLEQAMKAQTGSKLYTSLTLALDVGGWSTPSPCRSTPEKTWHPLYRRLVGPHGRSELERKSLPPPGFNPLTVQLVASRYTDSTSRAYYSHKTFGKSTSSKKDNRNSLKSQSCHTLFHLIKLIIDILCITANPKRNIIKKLSERQSIN
jgi:hypothetical protein